MVETRKPTPKAAVKAASKPAAAGKAKAAPKTAAPKAKTATTKTPPKSAGALAKAKAAVGVNETKVKDEMNNFKDKAADTARNAAERGKERASEAVSGIGKLLRESAETIDSNVGKNYGDYARNAADAVDGFAEKMNAKEVDDIVGDARDFVRKSPAVAIGAAAAIGFALVRLLRSGRDEA
jgi:ElaB/YqjD/DUF883 family membrane-anchored ribosome-binding protein